jgi:LPS sulfotransferase NodH
MDLLDVKREYEGRPHHPFYPEAVAFPPQKKYLLAMTPRSGSTRLAQHLSRQRCLGFPAEYLNEGFIATFEHLFPPPNLHDFETLVLSRFTSPTGVFGMKTDWWRFSRAREIGYLNGLHQDPDLFVLLRRRDLVSQAISLTISIQTNVWHDSNLRFADVEAAYAGLAYDEAQIVNTLISLLEQEHRWLLHLDSVATPHIDVFFEDTLEDLDAVCAEIAAALGVHLSEPEDAADEPQMQPVPSRVNGAWKARFVEAQPQLVEACIRYRGLVSPVDNGWEEKLAAGLSMDAHGEGPSSPKENAETLFRRLARRLKQATA